LTPASLSDKLSSESITQPLPLVKKMINGLKPAQRISLSDDIVEQLTGLIAREVLKPGERIPSEKQLCEQFGVGRTSVREALKSLSVMGILESHAGDGTFVSANRARYLERAFHWGLLLDRKMVKDLVETRLLLESHTTYLAARRATADDLEAMERAIQGMEASVSDPKRYLEYDLQFHLRIAQATQNAILGNLLGTIRGYLQSWVEQTLATSPPDHPTSRATLSIAQHRKILGALKKHGANDARRAMREHILSSQADVELHVAGKPHA
jgi:GntR family transcriptional regulator, transcriptional repressor for pyruvate dehydrogenase complex